MSIAQGSRPTQRPGTIGHEVSEGSSAARRERRRRAGEQLRVWLSPANLLALGVVLTVLLAAAWPTLFTSRDPLDGETADRLLAPSAEHWFGTDHLGRDVFARTVHGAELSLQAVTTAVLVGLVIGVLLGVLAGYFGGWLDAVLMRIADVLLAIPQLLLAMAIVVALGFGTINVAIAVGIASVANFARISRSEVLRWRHAVFVEAAQISGTGRAEIIVRHILPQTLKPVAALTTLQFGEAVLAVSSLSFLGFGAGPPTPEWGNLISEGRDYLATAWWLTTLPGLVVIAVVLAANHLSHTISGSRRSA